MEAEISWSTRMQKILCAERNMEETKYFTVFMQETRCSPSHLHLLEGALQLHLSPTAGIVRSISVCKYLLWEKGKTPINSSYFLMHFCIYFVWNSRLELRDLGYYLSERIPIPEKKSWANYVSPLVVCVTSARHGQVTNDSAAVL